jgi:uncharacterized protein (TIGR00106 family)
MPVLEISIMPIGTDEASFSSYVSSACEVVKKHGLEFKVTPMSTIVEGTLEELMSLAKDVHRLPFDNGVDRVITSMTIDERRDRDMDMDSMVMAVQNPQSR